MEEFIQNLSSFLPSLDENTLLLVMILALVGVLAILWLGWLLIKRIVLGLIERSYRLTSRLHHRWKSTEDDLRRVERRQQFADYIESEIRRLNNLESWSHYRFTELEAEVEADGEYKVAWWRRRRSGKRIEPSLSKALESTSERLILVEGEQGQTVELRINQFRAFLRL